MWKNGGVSIYLSAIALNDWNANTIPVCIFSPVIWLCYATIISFISRTISERTFLLFRKHGEAFPETKKRSAYVGAAS